MANLVRSTTVLVAVILLLGFLSVPTTARHINTLFITFSIEPHRVNQPNPNFVFFKSQNPNDDSSLTFFSDNFFNLENNGGFSLIDRPDFPAFDFELLPNDNRMDHHPPRPSFFGIDFDSLFDRSKDLLSVVAALLFGVGCGALTAVTMYFVWMLIVGRSEDEEDKYYSNYEDIPSPKKGGYVKIAADDAPAEAKEVA